MKNIARVLSEPSNENVFVFINAPVPVQTLSVAMVPTRQWKWSADEVDLLPPHDKILWLNIPDFIRVNFPSLKRHNVIMSG